MCIVFMMNFSLKNYLIDTSVKLAFYTPIMSTIEAANGLELDQIIQSRVSMALLDIGIARIYSKTADYLAELYDIDMKAGGLKAWSLDTCVMAAVYNSFYAPLLAFAGSNTEQISYSVAAGIVVTAATVRPFRKYALIPWREKWNYKK